MKKLTFSTPYLLISTFIAAQAPPQIASFSPASGPAGTAVTIAGANFNTIAADNIVYFGGTRATVTNASETSLTVTVPAGATFKPISVLNVENHLTGYSMQPFIVTFPGSAFSLGTKTDIAVGPGAIEVIAADMDGDGKNDIANVNYDVASASVLRNNAGQGFISSLSFDEKVDFTTGNTPRSIVTGDLDGDGRPDMAIVNVNSNTVSVFHNASVTGSINASSFAGKVDFATGTAPNGLSICDINGDGKPDLVVTNTTSRTLSILRNTSIAGSITSSSFAARVDFNLGVPPAQGGLTTGDVDGDGKPDVIVCFNNNNKISVYRNATVNTTIDASSLAAGIDFSTGSRPSGAAIGDLDGDGAQDIAVSNYSSYTISVFRNTATPGSITSSSLAAPVSYPAGERPCGIAIGDLTGDGKPDVTVANQISSGNVSILQNTSSPGSITSSSFAAATSFAAGSYPYWTVIADINNDGKAEVIAANYGSASISVLQNISAGPLPVTLTSFTAKKQPLGVQLSWQTSAEFNSHSFNIEKSADGRRFTVIGTVKAAGSSAQETAYRFRDDQPFSGENYYRLAQADHEGQMNLSKILLVKWQKETTLTVTVAPQPAHQIITVNISNNAGNGRFIIYDLNAKILKSYPVKAGNRTLSIHRTSMPAGLYFYKFMADNGTVKRVGKILLE